ncbi:MAG: hypothetical protein N4A54_09680 [Peptostreptococcaceae bacterium]|nr:hypothetical protein [Peptostreptococcaceae bacterium]
MKDLYKEFKIQRNINKLNINYFIIILLLLICISMYFNIKSLKQRTNIEDKIKSLNLKNIKSQELKTRYDIKNKNLNMDDQIKVLGEMINLKKDILEINYSQKKYYLKIKTTNLNEKIDLKNKKINIDEIEKKKDYFEINYEVNL